MPLQNRDVYLLVHSSEPKELSRQEEYYVTFTSFSTCFTSGAPDEDYLFKLVVDQVFKARSMAPFNLFSICGLYPVITFKIVPSLSTTKWVGNILIFKLLT